MILENIGARAPSPIHKNVWPEVTETLRGAKAPDTEMAEPTLALFSGSASKSDSTGAVVVAQSTDAIGHARIGSVFARPIGAGRCRNARTHAIRQGRNDRMLAAFASATLPICCVPRSVTSMVRFSTAYSRIPAEKFVAYTSTEAT